MLHPAFARALATARIEDLHRAAARRRRLLFALRVAHERDAAIRVDSVAGRRVRQAEGMTPTEIPRAEGVRSS